MSLRVPLLLLLAASCASPYRGEEVNISFTPSVDTRGHETWAFDLDACEDLHDVRFDSGLIRATLLDAIEDELEGRGLRRGEPADADLLVFHRLDVVLTKDGDGVAESTRGRLFLRDVETGRIFWVGERRTRITVLRTGDELEAAVREYVAEVLRYTDHLDRWSGTRVARTR